MKILHFLPACLIIFVFACIVIYSGWQTWKKEKYNEKLIYVKKLMSVAKTESDNITVFNELMDLQSRYKNDEVRQLIEKHCLKNKS
jgi:uncharacterized protein YxeA